MQTTRRSFLAGLTMSGLMARPTWADVGAPDFISALRRPNGSYQLAGLTRRGVVTFSIDLPGRGHAGAAHPHRPFAVAFARRPGTFAKVIDCTTGQSIADLHAPRGRHFYGHGTFSPDGAVLYATENDFETGQGQISLWDVEDGFRRIGAFQSGGVGPHDIQIMPDGQTLVVANGGIETHPDTGRAKLNLPTMRPNLSYFSLGGDVLDTMSLASPFLASPSLASSFSAPPDAVALAGTGPNLHKNSIRHLAVRHDGLVAFAMQWQGDTREHPALLGLHQMGSAPRLIQAPMTQHRDMCGYAGSVALAADGRSVAISSPHGGVVQVFDPDTGAMLRDLTASGVCGLGAAGAGFFYTTDTGAMGRLDETHGHPLALAQVQWDNHLVPIRTS